MAALRLAFDEGEKRRGAFALAAFVNVSWRRATADGF
jgi:hypothetical protein